MKINETRFGGLRKACVFLARATAKFSSCYVTQTSEHNIQMSVRCAFLWWGENLVFWRFIAKKRVFLVQEGRVFYLARATAKFSSRNVTQTSEHKLQIKIQNPFFGFLKIAFFWSFIAKKRVLGAQGLKISVLLKQKSTFLKIENRMLGHF